VSKQTRFFDANAGTTVLMREKQEEMDYRFMPEPDLPPLYVSEVFRSLVMK
jgi:aspartyl-tRNA(Asn)/glutamyl-tRNA(Gln) amidotransferase subunit B